MGENLYLFTRKTTKRKLLAYPKKLYKGIDPPLHKILAKDDLATGQRGGVLLYKKMIFLYNNKKVPFVWAF